MIKMKKLTLLLFSLMLAIVACQQEDEELPGETPTVNAGTDVNAVVGSSVQLSGTANDPDGDQLSISWTVTAAPSGSTASVNNASSLNATFTPDVAGNYTLTLTVSDNVYDPVTDELVITAAEAVGDPPVVTILGEDNRPISDANENNSVTVGTTYMLNGSNTADPDTDAADLTFTWEITESPAGSAEASITADATDPTMASFVPDAVGEYTIQLTVTDPEGNSDSETAVIIADANPVEISANISEDTVWPNVFENPDLPDYIVTSDISVSEQLEVMPGVKVIFEPNMRMSVSGNNGALISVGKADSLVVFTAEDSLNGWEGIIIFNNNVLNRLDYTEVSYGGNRDATSGVQPANVGVEGFGAGKVTITNSRINNSFGDGIYVEGGASLEGFSDNEIDDNTDYPLSLDASNVSIIDATTTYAGNGDNMVRILNSTLDMDDEQTWTALPDDVSYYLPANLEISSGLVISAGASFMAASESYININNDGYLEAIGTEADSIVFDAADAANGWRGLFYSSSNNRNTLAYVRVSNAGNASNQRSGVLPSAIGLEGFSQAVLSINNSTISNTIGDYGMFFEAGTTLREFANNSFSNNANFPLFVTLGNAGEVDNASVFSGNGTDAVVVDDATLSQDITLSNIADGTPYLFLEETTVNAELTIEAGTTLLFEEDVIFRIGGDGSMIAVGNMENMITFTARDTGSPWGGIIFFSTDVSNEMTYCEVSYGGNRGATSGVEPANIGLEAFANAELKLTNCNITNSSGYGVYVEGGSTIKNADNQPITTQTDLETAGNTFSNNTTADSNL